MASVGEEPCNSGETSGPRECGSLAEEEMDILLETGGEKKEMRNCRRADQGGRNDWTIKN